MQNTDLTHAAQSVPCIEVATQAPEGARRFAGPYYPDQAELLKSTLASLRDRRDYIVAPDAEGLINIYRRAKA